MERDSPPRLPLGHKLIAVVIAAAVGGGLHFWLARNAVQSTSTAELSFDPAAAERIDPGVVGSTEPAVAVAQSMLSDEAVAGLSKQAFLSSSSMAARVGEFRARLELTEPSTNVLRVQFRDADPAKAAGTANAVAKALAAGMPSAAAAPTAPVTAPQPAAKPSPRMSTAGRADHSLSDSLAELATLLSSTNRKLDNMGAPAGKSKNHHGRQHASEPASYSLARQQQLLKAQVRSAQKQLDEARAAAGHDSIPGAKERLAEIQQELSSILPGKAAGSHSFNGAGVDSGQMRRERAQLVRTIGVVEKARVAIRRQEDARAAPASEEPAASSSAASNTAAPAPAPQPAPVDTSATAGQPSQSPLRLVREAGTAAHTPWWPPVAGGLLAGLLYLGVAALRYRHHESEADYDGGTSNYGNRLITPDAPVSAADFSQHRVFKDLLETPPETRPQEHPRSAEAAPPQSPPEEHLAQAGADSQSTVSSAGVHPISAVSEEAAPESVLSSDAAEPAVAEHASPTGADEALAAEPVEPVVTAREVVAAGEEVGVAAEEVGVAAEEVGVAGGEVVDREAEVAEHEPDSAVAATEPVVAIREAEAPVANRQTVGVLEALPAMPLFAEQDAPRVNGGPGSTSFTANLVGMADPWTDHIRKTLSQTAIGRMFEGTLGHDEKSEPKRDEGAGSSDRSDRLAG